MIAFRNQLLLAHARGVHHAHSHVGRDLARGAHALHALGHWAAARAHAAEHALLRRHGSVHIHVALLHGATVVTHTHSHHLFRHHHFVVVHHSIHQ